MLLARLLNACDQFPGGVYAAVRLVEATGTIEVDVRPRRGSKPHCSCCGRAKPGYDVLPMRRFEFIPIWGYAVMLLYAMRRVQCRRCGVLVESVPWAMGKHSLTKAYMLYLAHWARKLSWKETALSFGTTWDQVCHAVEYVVQWGLEHRELGPLRAIGVDEIHIEQSGKFLTLVYQIEAGCTRLLWASKDRTMHSVEKFLRPHRSVAGRQDRVRLLGRLSGQTAALPGDHRQALPQGAQHSGRFHTVAKLNKALDKVHAGEARSMLREGYEPVLKNKRWCLLKRL